MARLRNALKDGAWRLRMCHDAFDADPRWRDAYDHKWKLLGIARMLDAYADPTEQPVVIEPVSKSAAKKKIEPAKSAAKKRIEPAKSAAKKRIEPVSKSDAKKRKMRKEPSSSHDDDGGWEANQLVAEAAQTQTMVPRGTPPKFRWLDDPDTDGLTRFLQDTGGLGTCCDMCMCNASTGHCQFP